MQAPSRLALNPSAVSIPLDVEIQQDRQRRMQRGVDEEGYLSDMGTPHIWDVKDSQLIIRPPKRKVSPRMASRWPVVGALKWHQLTRVRLLLKKPGLSLLILDMGMLKVRDK